jgi:hypothetical protein
MNQCRGGTPNTSQHPPKKNSSEKQHLMMTKWHGVPTILSKNQSGGSRTTAEVHVTEGLIYGLRYVLPFLFISRIEFELAH